MTLNKKKLEKLKHSVFYEVLFPTVKDDENEFHGFRLVKTVRYTVSAEVPIRKVPFVIVDIETTGLEKNNDRIIEIGAYKLDLDRKITKFESLISIPSKVPPEITKLTGINDYMLFGAPKFEDIATEFLDFIEGCILFGHNSQFDVGFLIEEYSRCGKALHWPTYCTLKMAKRVVPKLASYKLGSLAEHFGIKSSGTAHRALADVDTCLRVLIELMKIKKPETLFDLRMFEVKF